MAAGKRSATILGIVFCLTAPALAQTAEDGYAAYDAGDYAKARTILQPLAEAGDPKAMNRIGNMHSFGEGVSRDLTTACDWYEKAAQKGLAVGQYNFGLCLDYGDGRPKNTAQAAFWARKAAEQGYANAQIFLLRHYAEKDRKQAQAWGQMAADQGSVVARVVMRGYGITYSGPQASRFDIFCVLIMNTILKRPQSYCDARP